jgi:hypothetical protein
MEPISTAALAALILASRGSAEEMGKEAARSTWSGLSTLRALVYEKFRRDSSATQALATAEREPENSTAVARLRDSIEACSQEDRHFANELRLLVDEARQRPEYQRSSTLFANYGYIGKVTHFAGPVRVKGDFNIN